MLLLLLLLLDTKRTAYFCLLACILCCSLCTGRGHGGTTTTTTTAAAAKDSSSSSSSTCTPASTGLSETVRSALCWGDSGSSTITLVPYSPNFTEISVGGDHVCALANQIAQCWGSDYSGDTQVPSGHNNNNNNNNFIHISSGMYHTCGLMANGTAFCWGNNEYGQLSVPPNSKFVQISAGQYHTCGLIANGGSALCWGYDGWGQSSVPSNLKFVQISAGQYHTCGLLLDSGGGHALCWGYNGNGQADVPPDAHFKQISAGYYHSCGVLVNGTALCWGHNGNGQTAVPLPTSLNFTQVSAGQYHSCGVLVNESALCWGYNGFGQTDVPPGHRFTSIGTGSFITCGLLSVPTSAFFKAPDASSATVFGIPKGGICASEKGSIAAGWIGFGRMHMEYTYCLSSFSDSSLPAPECDILPLNSDSPVVREQTVLIPLDLHGKSTSNIVYLSVYATNCLGTSAPVTSPVHLPSSLPSLAQLHAAQAELVVWHDSFAPGAAGLTSCIARLKVEGMEAIQERLNDHLRQWAVEMCILSAPDPNTVLFPAGRSPQPASLCANKWVMVDPDTHTVEVQGLGSGTYDVYLRAVTCSVPSPVSSYHAVTVAGQQIPFTYFSYSTQEVKCGNATTTNATTTTVSLSWWSSPASDSYDYCIGKVGQMGCDIVVVRNTIAPGTTVTLASGSQYFISINSTNCAGTSTSYWIFFPDVPQIPSVNFGTALVNQDCARSRTLQIQLLAYLTSLGALTPVEWLVYCVGTTPGSCDTIPRTTVPVITNPSTGYFPTIEITVPFPSIEILNQRGYIYYVTMYAQNCIGAGIPITKGVAMNSLISILPGGNPEIAIATVGNVPCGLERLYFWWNNIYGARYYKICVSTSPISDHHVICDVFDPPFYSISNPPYDRQGVGSLVSATQAFVDAPRNTTLFFKVTGLDNWCSSSTAVIFTATYTTRADDDHDYPAPQWTFGGTLPMGCNSRVYARSPSFSSSPTRSIYCVGTSPGECDEIPPTAVITNQDLDVSLRSGETYYFTSNIPCGATTFTTAAVFTVPTSLGVPQDISSDKSGIAVVDGGPAYSYGSNGCPNQFIYLQWAMSEAVIYAVCVSSVSLNGPCDILNQSNTIFPSTDWLRVPQGQNIYVVVTGTNCYGSTNLTKTLLLPPWSNGGQQIRSFYQTQRICSSSTEFNVSVSLATPPLWAWYPFQVCYGTERGLCDLKESYTRQPNDLDFRDLLPFNNNNNKLQIFLNVNGTESCGLSTTSDSSFYVEFLNSAPSMDMLDWQVESQSVCTLAIRVRTNSYYYPWYLPHSEPEYIHYCISSTSAAAAAAAGGPPCDIMPATRTLYEPGRLYDIPIPSADTYIVTMYLENCVGLSLPDSRQVTVNPVQMPTVTQPSLTPGSLSEYQNCSIPVSLTWWQVTAGWNATICMGSAKGSCDYLEPVAFASSFPWPLFNVPMGRSTTWFTTRTLPCHGQISEVSVSYDPPGLVPPPAVSWAFLSRGGEVYGDKCGAHLSAYWNPVAPDTTSYYLYCIAPADLGTSDQMCNSTFAPDMWRTTPSNYVTGLAGYPTGTSYYLYVCAANCMGNSEIVSSPAYFHNPVMPPWAFIGEPTVLYRNCGSGHGVMQFNFFPYDYVEYWKYCLSTDGGGGGDTTTCDAVGWTFIPSSQHAITVSAQVNRVYYLTLIPVNCAGEGIVLHSSPVALYSTEVPDVSSLRVQYLHASVGNCGTDFSSAIEFDAKGDSSIYFVYCLGTAAGLCDIHPPINTSSWYPSAHVLGNPGATTLTVWVGNCVGLSDGYATGFHPNPPHQVAPIVHNIQASMSTPSVLCGAQTVWLTGSWSQITNDDDSQSDARWWIYCFSVGSPNGTCLNDELINTTSVSASLWVPANGQYFLTVYGGNCMGSTNTVVADMTLNTAIPNSVDAMVTASVAPPSCSMPMTPMLSATWIFPHAPYQYFDFYYAVSSAALSTAADIPDIFGWTLVNDASNTINILVPPPVRENQGYYFNIYPFSDCGSGTVVSSAQVFFYSPVPVAAFTSTGPSVSTTNCQEHRVRVDADIIQTNSDPRARADHYTYFITTSSGDLVVQNASTQSGQTHISAWLPQGVTYIVTVFGVNCYGVGPSVTSSPIVVPFTLAPGSGVPSELSVTLGSLSGECGLQLIDITWSIAHAASYSYCLGLSPGSCDLKHQPSTTTTSVQEKVPTGRTIFVLVNGTNCLGTASESTSITTPGPSSEVTVTTTLTDVRPCRADLNIEFSYTGDPHYKVCIGTQPYFCDYIPPIVLIATATAVTPIYAGKQYYITANSTFCGRTVSGVQGPIATQATAVVPRASNFHLNPVVVTTTTECSFSLELFSSYSENMAGTDAPTLMHYCIGSAAGVCNLKKMTSLDFDGSKPISWSGLIPGQSYVVTASVENCVGISGNLSTMFSVPNLTLPTINSLDLQPTLLLPTFDNLQCQLKLSLTIYYTGDLVTWCVGTTSVMANSGIYQNSSSGCDVLAPTSNNAATVFQSLLHQPLGTTYYVSAYSTSCAGNSTIMEKSYTSPSATAPILSPTASSTSLQMVISPLICGGQSTTVTVAWAPFYAEITGAYHIVANYYQWCVQSPMGGDCDIIAAVNTSELTASFVASVDRRYVIKVQGGNCRGLSVPIFGEVFVPASTAPGSQSAYTYANVPLLGCNIRSTPITLGWRGFTGEPTSYKYCISSEGHHCDVVPLTATSSRDITTTLFAGFTYLLSVSSENCIGTSDTISSEFGVYISQCCPLSCSGRGQCQNNVCNCYAGWMGENCSEVVYVPEIAIMPDVTVWEEFPFIGSIPTIIKGTRPIEFSLSNPPSQSITINSTSGQVLWAMPTAAPSAYPIVIQAKNSAGIGAITFQLKVKGLYNATLHTSGIPSAVPRGRPITFTGKALSRIDNSVVVNRPVIVWVRGSSQRVFNVLTDSTGFFSFTFYPNFYEGGTYDAGACHPYDTTFDQPQVTFTIEGLVVLPATMVVNLLVGVPSTYTLTLTNIGSYPASNINYLITGNTTALQFSRTTTPPPSFQIAPGEHFYWNFTITGEEALTRSRRINITFETTSNGAHISTTFQMSVIVNPHRAHLVARPSTLSRDVVKGGSALVSFMVFNQGGASATNVQLSLPNIPHWLTLISPTIISSLPPGGNMTVNLLLTPPADSELGSGISGNIVIMEQFVFTSVSFSFTIVSNLTCSLMVFAKDEFTYYASDRPLVANASIIIRDAVNGGILLRTGMTNASGIAAFDSMTEGYYDVAVTATNHSGSTQRILQTCGDAQENQVTAFLKRVLVEVTFNVVPTTVVDHYIITISTTFITHVPAPVITLTPQILSLENLVYTQTFQFNITNSGLISGRNSRISLPENDFYSFSWPNGEYIGEIPAMTSIIQILVVTRKVFSGLARSGRDFPPIPPCLTGGLVWQLECGGNLYSYSISINVENLCRQPALHNDPGPGSEDLFLGDITDPNGSFSLVEPTTSTFIIGPPVVYTPAYCNKCVSRTAKTLAQCAIKSAGTGLGVAAAAMNCLLAGQGISQATSGSRSLSVSSAVGITGNLAQCAVGILCPECALALRLAKCLSASADLLVSDCAFGLKKRDQADLNQARLALARQAQRVQTYVDLLNLIFPQNWLDAVFVSTATAEDTSKYIGWASNLKQALAAASEQGFIITSNEYTMLTDPMGLPSFLSLATVETLLDRLNVTFYLYSQGVFQDQDTIISGLYPENLIDGVMLWEAMLAFYQAVNESNAAGYDDLFAGLIYEYDRVQADLAEPDQGVCAKVQLKLEQDIAVTREAFKATLELKNHGDLPLFNVTVIIRISDIEGVDATSLFVIALTDREGLVQDEGAIGSWSVPEQGDGVIHWLIEGLPEAALLANTITRYRVAGELFYSLDGQVLNTPLFPVDIYVAPSPMMIVDYFFQRDIVGDDPFTLEREPSQPFYLGLTINNIGEGTAKEVSIASGQPQIVNNEKGLLVSFRLLGSQVQDQQVPTPTMQAVLGDIGPHQTKTALWSLICSLQGTMTDFNITYEYRSPLGDERLSQLKTVRIHELTRVVAADNDSIPDWLVNDFGDSESLPDRLYTSQGMEYSVLAFNLINTTLDTIFFPDSHVAVVRISFTYLGGIFGFIPGWSYLRLNDPLGPQYVISSIVTSDELGGTTTTTTTTGHVNVWRTRVVKHYTDQPAIQWLHLLDLDSRYDYIVVYTLLQDIQDLRENGTTLYSISLVWTAPPNVPDVRFKIEARDVSQNDLSYLLVAQDVIGGTYSVTGLQSHSTYSFRIYVGTEIGYLSTFATTTASTLSLNETSSTDPTPPATPSSTPPTTTTPSSTPSITSTATPTTTSSPTITPTGSPTTTSTPSSTPSITQTRSPSTTPTSSITPSATLSTSSAPSSTPSTTQSFSSTPSITHSATPSTTATPSITPSAAPSASSTPSPTPSITHSRTPSMSTTPSLGPSLTPSSSSTLSSTPSTTQTRSPSTTATPSTSSTLSSTPSTTQSFSSTPSITHSATPSTTATPSITPSTAPSASSTPSSTPSTTQSFSSTPSITHSATPSTTVTPSITPSATPSTSSTLSSTPSTTQSFSSTPSLTHSATSSTTATSSITPSTTPSTSSTLSSTPSTTQSFSATPSITHSATPSTTTTPSITSSATPSTSSTLSPTPSTTQSFSSTPSITHSPTPSTAVTPSTTPSAAPSTSSAPSLTPSTTQSHTPSITLSTTLSTSSALSPTPSTTQSFSSTPSTTHSPTPSTTATPSITSSATPSTSFTSSSTPSTTQSFSSTPSLTHSPTPSTTGASSETPSSSLTATPTSTPSITQSTSGTLSITLSPTPSISHSLTTTPSISQTGRTTPSVAGSPSGTKGPSPSNPSSPSVSKSPVVTRTPVRSPSSTRTPSLTPSVTRSPTSSISVTHTASYSPSSTRRPRTSSKKGLIMATTTTWDQQSL